MQVVCPNCQGINRVPDERLNQAPKCGRCKQQLFQAKPLAMSAEALRRHQSRGDLPLLVDFWAPWCGPCRGMAPAFEAAAASLEPRVRLGKVNTESEPQIAAQMGIRSIPTLILFAGDREVARHSGALMEADIIRWTQSHL